MDIRYGTLVEWLDCSMQECNEVAETGSDKDNYLYHKGEYMAFLAVKLKLKELGIIEKY